MSEHEIRAIAYEEALKQRQEHEAEFMKQGWQLGAIVGAFLATILVWFGSAIYCLSHQ